MGSSAREARWHRLGRIMSAGYDRHVPEFNHFDDRGARVLHKKRDRCPSGPKTVGPVTVQ